MSARTTHAPSRPVRVRQISEIANAMLDPVLARRAGIDTVLLGAWPEIAGESFADCTKPEAIKWPPRPAHALGEQTGFAPGVLTVACEGARAVFFMHALDEIRQRINAFFGFPAIGRIRVVQKPVEPIGPARRPPPATLAPDERRHLDAMLGAIEDPRLKRALERLGREVIARAR